VPENRTREGLGAALQHGAARYSVEANLTPRILRESMGDVLAPQAVVLTQMVSHCPHKLHHEAVRRGELLPWDPLRDGSCFRRGCSPGIFCPGDNDCRSGARTLRVPACLACPSRDKPSDMSAKLLSNMISPPCSHFEQFEGQGRCMRAFSRQHIALPCFPDPALGAHWMSTSWLEKKHRRYDFFFQVRSFRARFVSGGECDRCCGFRGSPADTHARTDSPRSDQLPFKRFNNITLSVSISKIRCL